MERIIRPKAAVLEALTGKVSEPLRTVSQKPRFEGSEVTVRLSEEGPCMAGLIDVDDNREWFGINNHQWLSARYAVNFSKRMAEAGYDTDPGRILNAMLVSHTGRRQWDEAGWYPDAVKNAKQTRSISNETLGMQLIDGEVPGDVFGLVVALGHGIEGFSVDPKIYESWDYKIAIYTDHRTTQKYEPLHTRMGDFLLGNFYKREDVTPELKEEVYGRIESMIAEQKQRRFLWIEPFSVDDADEIAKKLGAAEISSRLVGRKELMRLVLQDADTEATLIAAGIDPDEINDETVPEPRWERYLKRLYLNDAEEGVFQLRKSWGNIHPLDGHFMIDWESEVLEIYSKHGGVPYKSQNGKPQGTQRAIEFFRYLDTLPLTKGEKVDKLQEQS